MTAAAKRTGGESTLTPMELLQAELEAGAQAQELALTIHGQDFTIRWRPLTWLEKSAVLSAALDYVASEGKEGVELQAKLRHDVFRREALKIMIIESPIPLTSDKVLDKLPEEIGSQLEKIIPSPFSSEQAASVKKG